MNLFTLQEGNR